MSNEDEHFAARLRAEWPAPVPSAGFDAALERRLVGRPRPVWAFALAGALVAAALVVVLRPQVPLEVPAPVLPEVAMVADDAFYAALDLEAEEEEWLPEDYAGLAEVLDL